MARIVIWIVGLAFLSTTYVAAIYFKADNIEYDLKDRVNLVITSKNISWAKVTISGRDAILEGKAPDQAAINQAEQDIMAVWGVRRVECHCENLNPDQPDTDNNVLVVKPPAKQCQAKIDQQLQQHSIEFASGSSMISDTSQPLLESLVDTIKACPKSMIKIAGHTDNRGNTDKNITLSLDRAEAVLAYFIVMDIPRSQLKAVGYGDSSPRETNNTAVGRKRNRRIEIIISP